MKIKAWERMDKYTKSLILNVACKENYDSIVKNNNHEFSESYKEILPDMIKKAGTFDENNSRLILLIKSLCSKYDAKQIKKEIDLLFDE